MKTAKKRALKKYNQLDNYFIRLLFFDKKKRALKRNLLLF
jgi:hypothetical protein